jgi:Tfp pilus assembly protein PilO
MTVSQRAKQKKGRERASFSSRLVKAGPAKVLAVSTALAVVIAGLCYWQFLTAADAANQAKRGELKGLRKQNAIARTVQETRPAFLAEYRRAKAVYESGRELLPSSTELSRVMSAIQMVAKKNGVRITLFDASALGGKSPLDNTAPPPGAPRTAHPNPPQAGAGAPAQGEPKNVLKERVIPTQVVGRHSAVMNFFREVAAYGLIIHARDPKIVSLNGQESVNVKLVAFEAPPSEALPADPPDLASPALAAAYQGGAKR